jgi:predicted NBD/HSP70 family sugar kinase
MKPFPDYIRNRLDCSDLASSRRVLCLVAAQGPVSHASAAERLTLSAGTCNLHFQRLEHEGLIRRHARSAKGKGRPTVLWELDGARNLCVTFVFDVPCFEAHLSDFDGNVLLQERHDLDGTADRAAVIARIHAFMAACLKESRGRRARIRQVFAAFPGLLHPETGAVIKAVNFPALDGLDVRAVIRNAYKLPCFTGSLGLAYFQGETEGVDSTLTTMVVHWDLGVNVVFGRGQSVLSLQAPESGQRPLISEMGHVRIRRGGRLCHCGGRGCLEAYAGGWALLEQLHAPRVRTLGDFVRRVQEGDKRALAIAGRAASLLGGSLVVLLQTLCVDRITVTGPVSSAFAAVARSFREGLLTALDADEVARLNPTASPNPEARLRRGAFLLARRLFFHPEEYAVLPQSPARLTAPQGR